MPSLQLQNSPSCKTGKLRPHETLIPPPSPPTPAPPALATTIIRPVSRNQTPPGTSWKRDPAGPILSRLASLTEQRVLRAHPRGTQCQDCFPFSGWRVFPSRGWTTPCLSIPPPVDTWVFPPSDCCGPCCSEHRRGDICLSLCFWFWGVHAQR